MQTLSEKCEHHLEKALAIDDPQEKNYHVRQALQISSIGDLPEDFEPSLIDSPEEAIK